MADYKNTKLLTKAEVYCIIGRKIRPYLLSPEYTNQILFSESNASDLLSLLRPALSRSVFDATVKVDSKHKQEIQYSDTDEYALETGRLKEILM